MNMNRPGPPASKKICGCTRCRFWSSPKTCFTVCVETSFTVLFIGYDMRSNYQWLPDRHRPEGMVCKSVLQDVEQCLEWLEEESDEFRFRMALIVAVTLIRTVGHVLRNVDGSQHPTLMEIITRRFHEWKRDRAKARVFWEFIEAERNS